MRLEAVTAELRPRSEWEAVDLGLALVRRDFWSLASIWCLGMSPLLPVAFLLLPDHPFWFCLAFWWWIPVASRLVLFKLSRRLFGDDPERKDVIREFPRAIKRRFFYRMIWARLSPWRPLTMPIEDLEGLKGKDYSMRCRVLMRRGDSSVIMLAMWRLFLSFWIAVSIFFTAAMFVPDGVGERWSEAITLWFESERASPPLSLSMVVVAAMCCSMCLVDLFSIGAGFGIYVNHRTWVEGWDVELAFRRLGSRLKGVAGVLMFGLLVFFAPSGHADESGEVIDRVLADDDFKIHKETIKTPKMDWLDDLNWNGSSGAGSGGFLEILSALLKTGLFVGLLALLGWLIYRYRHVFRASGGGGGRAGKPQAKVVMGMAVAPESLPEDVSDAALRLWREGRRHEAMSLLYRGSISWMITRGGVEIAESDTESDCLTRVQRAGAGHLDYFDGLTRLWMKLAYGREEPADAEVEKLCGNWPFSERGVG